MHGHITGHPRLKSKPQPKYTSPLQRLKIKDENRKTHPRMPRHSLNRIAFIPFFHKFAVTKADLVHVFLFDELLLNV
jgi:hypothetical protein